MREKQFIKENKSDWQNLYERADQSLIKKVAEQASYARTFFTHRKLSNYLNDLVVFAWLKQYNRTSKKKAFNSFWLHELPIILHANRLPIRISLLVFLVSMLVGAVSSAGDDSFLVSILGADYVQMTLENIWSGDPMRVYKQKNQIGMAAGITANNLFVSLFMYVLGITAGIGSLGLLIGNGVLIGTFQYLFISEGLWRESFLAIWTHGLPEVSAIILSGGAGMTLGRGVLSGSLEKFKKSARDGFKILIGITPILVFAGFAEGYLTRFTDAPDVLRMLFLAVCMAFILIYFVWFPYLQSKWVKGDNKDSTEQILNPRNTEDWKEDFIYRHRSAEEILKATFRWVDHRFIFLITGAALFFLMATIIGKNLSDMVFPNKILGTINRISQFFHTPLQWLVFFCIQAYLTTEFFKEKVGKSKSLKQVWIFIFPAGFMAMVLAFQHVLTPILILFMAPIFFVAFNFIWLEEKWTLITVVHFLKGQTLKLIGLQLNLFLVSMILIAVFDAYFVQFILNTVTDFLPDYLNAANSISKGILTFTFLFLIYGIYGLMVIAMCWQTGAIVEVKFGRGLWSRIRQWLPLLLFFIFFNSLWAQNVDEPIEFDKDLWKREISTLQYFDLPELEHFEEPSLLEEFFEWAPWGWILYGLSLALIILGIFLLLLQYYRQRPVLKTGVYQGDFKRQIKDIAKRKWTKEELKNLEKNEDWVSLIRAYHASLLDQNKVSLSTSNRTFLSQISNYDKRKVISEINSLFERNWYRKRPLDAKIDWEEFSKIYAQLNNGENEK